ncbi:TonB-dependent siderophore receptor [Massilia sp. CCM 8733]|uniref:TonB-dependent siderophore receptor n=1 Tax=Massilia mucilaginosa TaxID=2609282 RepID=A0ABX0NT36_9BURK|nr:TonB-dependent siderophore receptor [Massilia mucilaginosa]NHZ89924.1 TonB-dependent siderophore receptor [Massilia mucilaginosa]
MNIPQQRARQSAPFRRTAISAALQAACLGLALASSASHAQDAAAARQETVLPTVSIFGERAQEQGYVASRSAAATKTDTPLIETPQAISVITRAEMDARNVRDLGEAVAYSAGVTSGGTGETTLFGGNSVRVRGFGGGGTAGFSFNEYLDGMKLQGTGYDGGNLDPYLLERVDVVKGPASVLFGQTQPGGIVNMVSKRAGADMVNEVRLGAGTRSHVDAGVDAGGAIGSHLHWRVTGLALDEHLQQDPAKRKRKVVAPSLTWSNGKTSLTALAHYQQDDINATLVNVIPAAGLFGNPGGRVAGDLRVGDPGFENWDRTTSSIGYLFSHAVSDTLALRQNLRYSRNELDSRWLYRRALAPDRRTLNRSAFSAVEDAANLNLDNQLEWTFKSGAFKHTLLAGVDYQRRTNDAVRHFGFNGVPALDLFAPKYKQAVPAQAVFQSEDVVGRQLGVYVQDQVKLGSLSLLVGGRHDQAHSRTLNRLNNSTTLQDDDAFTGRVGVIYNFAGGVAPYVSYATSFEPISGRAFNGGIFEPMKGKQVEAGLKYQPAGSAHMVTFALFDLTQQNMTTGDPEHTGFSIQTGEVRTRGIELEGKAQLLKDLDLTAAYTYLDDEVRRSNNPDLGKRRAQIPAHSASVWANYSVRAGALAGLGLGLGARYTGKTQGDTINSFAAPGHTLFDLALRYDLGRLGMKAWMAELHVNNVADKEYVASCFATHSCYLGLSRSARASLKYNW